MSMMLEMWRLSAEDVAKLHAEPELTSDYFLGPEEGEDSDEEEPAGEGEDDGCAARRPPPGFGARAPLYLGKAWHALHYLLTGSAWEGEGPLRFLASGGTELGDELVYGPARIWSVDEVRAIAAALADLPTEVLLGRVDPAAMTAAEIYPAIWDRDEDFAAFIGPAYEELRAFMREAAARGEGMVAATL